jgi:hypothetical protein
LRFEQGNKTLHLTPGSYVNIAARESTGSVVHASMKRFWLAVFY